MSATEQPEDLRAALTDVIVGDISDVALDSQRLIRKKAQPKVDDILRLCEAAALAALPKKVHTTSVKELQALSPSGDANEGVGFERGRNSTIATAQANIHKRFGGTGK